MARYRVYLMDEADFVQRTAAIECGSDADAVDHARTLIRDGGQVRFWTDNAAATALIGWFRPHPEPFSAALVRRSRVRSAPGNAPAARPPVARFRRMCPA